MTFLGKLASVGLLATSALAVGQSAKTDVHQAVMLPGTVEVLDNSVIASAGMVLPGVSQVAAGHLVASSAKSAMMLPGTVQVPGTAPGTAEPELVLPGASRASARSMATTNSR